MDSMICYGRRLCMNIKFVKIITRQDVRTKCTTLLLLTSYGHRCKKITCDILSVPGMKSHSTSQMLRFRFRIYIISRSFPLGWLMLRVSTMPQRCSRTNGRCACILYPLATTRVMETSVYCRMCGLINPDQTQTRVNERSSSVETSWVAYNAVIRLCRP